MVSGLVEVTYHFTGSELAQGQEGGNQWTGESQEQPDGACHGAVGESRSDRPDVRHDAVATPLRGSWTREADL